MDDMEGMETSAGLSEQPGAASGGEQVPQWTVETLLAKCMSLETHLQQYAAVIKSLESNANQKKNFDTCILKPIDAKDIKKPDEYDNDVKVFDIWFQRIKDLMINRHLGWEYIISGIETWEAKNHRLQRHIRCHSH